MAKESTSTGIKLYLEQRVAHGNKIKLPGFIFGNMEAFVLTHGQPFRAQALPKKYKRGEMKECFRNALMLAQEHDLIYVEGYAVGVVPTLHGWCVDNAGNVVDPTWPDGRGKEYYGVPFRLEYAIEFALKARTFCLIDRWEDEWPLLRELDFSKYLFPLKI